MRRSPWTTLLLLAVMVVGTAAVDLPWQGRAAAYGLAAGMDLAADFLGNGKAQIAALYDLDDDFGLRIDLLERSSDSDAFTRTRWFLSVPGSFDTARMKVAPADVDFDGRADIVALYDDGGTSVRLLVWRSTGSGFAYTGDQGWWRSDGYAWGRAKAIVAGNFSAIGRSGLLVMYQYDDFRLRVHYFESDGRSFVYGGNQGVYDSGPGQYDTARARFAVGRFTRASGPDQLVALYQYPNFRIRIHVFEPTPAGLAPVNGWAGVFDSGEGQYDLGRAKVVAADIDGDGRGDLASLYRYDDGSVRVHLFRGAAGLAFTSAASTATIDPGVIEWTTTALAAGDWDGDRRADLATLRIHDDGSTHVGMLRSQGDRLAFVADAWVSPPSEARTLACTQCWPLRGTALAGGDVTRRPLVVKIDNAPEARPQIGFGQADMVWELLAEGNITRYAAMFHSQDPGTVGPIRSARFTDRYTTPMVRGALAYSGASTVITDLIRADAAEGRYLDLDANLRGATFYFDLSRRSPHNTFTSGTRLRQSVASLSTAAVRVPRFPFLARSTDTAGVGGMRGSVAATEFRIPYRSDRALVTWRYDAGSGTYARWQNDEGSPVRTVDGGTRAPIAARNVAVMWTDFVDSGQRDTVGSVVFDQRMTGTGPASVFRDGLRQDGTWSRGSVFEAFRFTTVSGEQILLAPGHTWFHVIPIDWVVTSK
ncbi:MAG: DUF3048 domain-containing protein [Chloroflexi bacterium]|nr:DUF3048 domain-containing protein [Chloroflexota bacterium]